MINLKKLTPEAAQALKTSWISPAFATAENLRECMEGSRMMIKKLSLMNVEPVADDGSEIPAPARAALQRRCTPQQSLKLGYNGEKSCMGQKNRFVHLLLAAEGGSLRGMLETALCYAQGHGTDKNPGKARWWLEKSVAICAELYYWAGESEAAGF